MIKYRWLFFPALVLFLTDCASKKINAPNPTYETKLDTLTLIDKSRSRKIPVAFYSPKADMKNSRQQVVIFNHGYGMNKGGDYFVYSYLTGYLASKGYFVVSIQHELPTDNLLPLEGNLQIVRMPFWKQGSRNILFVLNELKKTKPELDYRHLTIIGHSNGGDMTALFATEHPEMVYRIITLDNRRMYLPRTMSPRIYTLRSNDYPADKDVLPSPEEQKKYHINVQNTDINHGSMDDKGSPEEKKTLINYIEMYLREN